MRALLFAGQGSQRRGMGAEVFGAYPEHCALADDILGYSIRDLCLRDDGDRLKLTRYAQPAPTAPRASYILQWISPEKGGGTWDKIVIQDSTRDSLLVPRTFA